MVFPWKTEQDGPASAGSADPGLGAPLRQACLPPDSMAAAIVTIMLMPQLLAYAMLVGLLWAVDLA